MSENHKNLVEQIKKLAAVPTRSKGDKTPAPAAPTGSPTKTPSPAGGGTSVPSRTKGVPTKTQMRGGPGVSGTPTQILAMQRTLQELAKDVTSTINLQEVMSDDPRKQNEARERDAFGVFLTKNYMRNTQVQGVEYDPDPKVTGRSDKEKTANDPTRLSVVMDTMYRVGNPQKGERMVDGIWDFRTNAAVRDAFAFASGLFDFVDDVNRFATQKMQVQSYNKASLQNLSSMATPDNSLTPAQKAEAAPLVTQHVKAIHQMYKEIKNKILQHKAYQKFIEGDQPFKTYQAAVTQQQIDLLNKQFPDGVPFELPGGGVQKAPVGVLLKLDSLNAWLNSVVPPESRDKLTPDVVLNSLWKTNQRLLGEVI